MLTPDGGLLEDDRRRFSLGFSCAAAAFDASGDRLALLCREDALVVEIASPPRLAQRLDLAPLATLLGPPAHVALEETLRDPLLQRLGTMRAVAHAPDALFAELGIDAATAQALRLAASEAPERLGT